MSPAAAVTRNQTHSQPSLKDVRSDRTLVAILETFGRTPVATGTVVEAFKSVGVLRAQVQETLWSLVTKKQLEIVPLPNLPQPNIAIADTEVRLTDRGIRRAKGVQREISSAKWLSRNSF